MNSKAIQARMKSIKQTVQIANAQKLIAASRVGKARRMLEQASPYHDHIRQTIAEILSMDEMIVPQFVNRSEGEPQKQGIIVFSSDTGLAGGYNSNVLRFAQEEYKKQNVTCFFIEGRVGRNYFTRSQMSMDKMNFPAGAPSMFNAMEIGDYIMSLFQKREVDAFDVIYTHYDSMVRLTPVRERLFPLSPEDFGSPPPYRPDMTFEPTAIKVMEMLLPRYLKGFLYGCMVHAYACELASRVQAMDSAIRNGNEMLDKLSLMYNRARQAKITQEITEIVAGATAMNDT